MCLPSTNPTPLTGVLTSHMVLIDRVYACVSATRCTMSCTRYVLERILPPLPDMPIGGRDAYRDMWDLSHELCQGGWRGVDRETWNVGHALSEFLWDSGQSRLLQQYRGSRGRTLEMIAWPTEIPTVPPSVRIKTNAAVLVAISFKGIAA